MAAAKGIKTKKIQEVEAQAVLESVKDLDLNKVVSEVGSLQVTLQETLANLSASLTSKVQKLSQVDQAIQLKEARLQELFGIEKEAVAIDDLKAQREQQELDHDDEVVARRQTWNEEESERTKRWRREEEEHTYATTQARQRAIDEHAVLVAKNQRDEAIRQEALNKSWLEREQALKAKEQEFTALKAQVDTFESRLKSEVAKAETIVGNTLKKQYEHEKALLTKDFETETKLNAAKVASFTDTISNLNTQIRSLESQLSQAHRDAKEVANQALVSASGRQAMDAVQQVISTRDNSTASKTK